MAAPPERKNWMMIWFNNFADNYTNEVPPYT